MNESITPPVLQDYDAHETARPNEPKFTVQGGDPVGPATVQSWADAARARARWILKGGRADFDQSGSAEYNPTERDMLDADILLRKATAAEGVVADMIAYQKGQIVAEAQAPEQLDEGEVTVDTRKALIRGSSRLNNALAETNDVAETLQELRLHPEMEVALRESVEVLRLAAKAIDPRKGNERS